MDVRGTGGQGSVGFVRQAIAFFHGVYGVGTCSKIFEGTLFFFLLLQVVCGSWSRYSTAHNVLGSGILRRIQYVY